MEAETLDTPAPRTLSDDILTLTRDYTRFASTTPVAPTRTPRNLGNPHTINRRPEHNRAEVARNSIAAVVHVAKLMPDDPVLACAVSAAIYNFVSRQGGLWGFPQREAVGGI